MIQFNIYTINWINKFNEFNKIVFYITILYMASTRNKNTSLNYNVEQQSQLKQNNYTKLYGEAYKTNLSGNGLIHGMLPRDQLSSNSMDTESFLFGINSTNLVNPAPTFEPSLRQLNPVDIYNKGDTFMPEPFICQKGQRPLYK